MCCSIPIAHKFDHANFRRLDISCTDSLGQAASRLSAARRTEDFQVDHYPWLRLINEKSRSIGADINTQSVR